MPTDDSPRICNCTAMRRASRVVTQRYDRHLAKAGLTATQFTILMVLDEHPGIAMAHMSALLAMERTGLLRTLKPLFRDGYVVEKGSEASRKKVLQLSQAGREVYVQALPYWQAAQSDFESSAGQELARALYAWMFAFS